MHQGGIFPGEGTSNVGWTRWSEEIARKGKGCPSSSCFCQLGVGGCKTMLCASMLIPGLVSSEG